MACPNHDTFQGQWIVFMGLGMLFQMARRSLEKLPESLFHPCLVKIQSEKLAVEGGGNWVLNCPPPA